MNEKSLKKPFPPKKSFPRLSSTITDYTIIHNTIIKHLNETTDKSKKSTLKSANCSIYKINCKIFIYKYSTAKKIIECPKFELVNK